MSKTFWLVWNPAKDIPKHKHESKTSAAKEAERLALAVPGDSFVVLESLGHYQTVRPIKFTKHERSVEFKETSDLNKLFRDCSEAVIRNSL